MEVTLSPAHLKSIVATKPGTYVPRFLPLDPVSVCDDGLQHMKSDFNM